MRYNNYHKHTHYSNIFTPDTHTKIENYIQRAVELGHTTYFTTEHGSGGDIFEAKTLCIEHGLKCIFALEAYIVVDQSEKDNRNYHIMLIAKTDKGRRKLNKINSKANIDGFYYKPRLSVSDLLTLDKDDIYITTACMGGIIRDEEGVDDIFLPLVNHFKDSIFLEVQNHLDEGQMRLNKKALELSEIHNVKIIAGNDSHYIYEEDAKDRKTYLEGKHINYGSEDTFILDYPSYETMYDRFVRQGILSKEKIEEAINNTLIFDECEDLQINKEIKMPTIHPNLTRDERVEKVKEVVYEAFEQVEIEDDIHEEDLPKYKEALDYEFSVIEETKELDTADYFLFNKRMVDLAVHKYGGILTRSGRGSASSYYINRVLGMTQVDRVTAEIPLYPERFISTARLLENRSLPDIDYNVVSQQPFIDATRELLGDKGCYGMVAYGTLQEGEAFRNVCRSKGIPFEEFNEIAKNIDKYKTDKKWSKLYEESKKFIDVVTSASIHPCAFVLFNGDIEEELGVVRVGKNICCLITSGEADDWKYLKNDYLVVSVWSLISKTFEKIGKPIMSIPELNKNLDDKVWEMYEKGLTTTLNQTDSDWATSLVKKYKPKNVEDMAKFVACIRPSFNSWRDKFIDRLNHTNGVESMDNLLKSTDNFILFQENLMQYFVWLGVSPSDAISLIKKISKKKIEQEDFDNLESSLLENWIIKTGSEDKFHEIWHLVQSCIEYGFCSAHGLCVAYDSVYGAYLKSHYPYEYYTVALNEYKDDQDRTGKLIEELEYFGISVKNIQFGKSVGEYSFDKDTKAIYKGVGSIKFLNSVVADEIFELSKTQYKTFADLLLDINQNTSTNSRQLKILIELDYFSQFGNARELLSISDMVDRFKFGEAKTIKKDKIESDEMLTLVSKYATDKNRKRDFRYNIENSKRRN